MFTTDVINQTDEKTPWITVNVPDYLCITLIKISNKL